MDPHSQKRICWLIMGLTFMLYDLVVVPLQAFQMEEELTFMAVTQAFYWTFDILFNFFTAVYVRIELVRDLRQIARIYLMSWFVFDVMVIGPTWVELLSSSGGSALRFIRILRFFRLIRLAKFALLLSEALKSINSPSLILCISLMKLVFYLACLCHLSACCWYIVGKSDHGWTHEFRDRDTQYMYLTSLHWVITQFQGSSDLGPGNSAGERAYAAATTMGFFLVAAAFISNFTNIVVQLEALSVEKNRQVQYLGTYLSEHHISRGLAMRVKKYLLWKQELDRDRSFEVLKLLPAELAMELKFEVHYPCMASHEFFCEFATIYPRLSRRLIDEAMSPSYFSPDYVVFTAQESCFRMYFVVFGELDYTVLIRRDGAETILGKNTVQPGSCLSEAALWMRWQHKGTLVTVNFTQMLSFNAERFRAMCSAHPPALTSCTLYARRLVEGMETTFWKVTDMFLPSEVIGTAAEERQFLNALTEAKQP